MTTTKPISPLSPIRVQSYEEMKDLDSPRTRSTLCSDDDECQQEFTRTPSPMRERLGRVLLSARSSPSTLDESSSSSDASTMESSTIRFRTIRRAQHETTTTTTTNDHKHKALLEALQQLNRLASLDSTEYQQRLLENSLPVIVPQTHPLQCPNLLEDAANQSSSLAFSSFQTPLLQLSMTIHRLHATIANVTSEVDGHSDEVHELRSQLETLRKRNRRVETAAKKVHQRNLELKEKTRQHHNLSKILQRKVRSYESKLESQQNQLLVSRVHHHEIQLQLAAKRDRLDEQEPAAIVSVGSDLSETSSSDTTSLGSKSDSVWTMEGTTEASSSSIRRSPTSDDKDRGEPSPPCHATSVNRDNAKEQHHIPQPSLSSRLQQFLGPRAIPNYTLRMVPPCALQFVALPLEKASTTTTITTTTVAFAVCGYEGFDAGINMVPTMGARLLKINGEPVGEDWTLEQVYHQLDRGGNHKPTTIALTFRNEEWSGAQTRVLRSSMK